MALSKRRVSNLWLNGLQDVTLLTGSEEYGMAMVWQWHGASLSLRAPSRARENHSPIL